MRFKWLKRIAITLLCLILLTTLLAGGLWLYLRSENFNRFVAAQIKSKLPEYGLRGEIGNFGISLRANQARLKDLQIYNQQTGQPIAFIKEIDITLRVPDLYALKLSREVILDKITVNGLEVFVEVDEQGKTNFEGLHAATSKSTTVSMDTSGLTTRISGGVVHFSDRLRKISAELKELSAEAAPVAGARDAIQLQCSAGQGDLAIDKRPARLDSLSLRARLLPTSADIEEISVKTNVADVKAAGKLVDWAALHYTFDVESNVRLGEAARLVDLKQSVTGSAVAKARIEGRTTGDLITGSLRAEQIALDGTTLRNLQATGISIDAKKNRIEFSGSRLSADSIDYAKIAIKSLNIENPKGAYADGVTKALASGATVASVAWPESTLQNLRLGGITADFTESGRIDIQALASNVSGEISTVSFSDASAKASFDNEALLVDEVRARVLGGEVKGNFHMPLNFQVPSSATAEFSGLQANETAKIFQPPAGGKISDLGTNLTGAVTGNLDLRIPILNPKTVSGTLQARLDGQSAAGSDGIPLQGDVAIRLDSGDVNFENVSLSTDVSKLTAQGTLTNRGNSDLRISLTSTQSEQFVRIARGIEAARPTVEQYEPQLIGGFKFDGRVTGSLDTPSIEGDLQIETAGLRDAILGTITGHIAASAQNISISNGLVTTPSGGTMKFDVATPLDAKAEKGTLNLLVDRVNLETILAAVGAPNANQFISGDVIGEAHLEGLPAAPEGMAQLRLVDAKIADQPAETAVAEVRFDDKDAFLEKLEIKMPQSRLTANGSMNLKDYAFKLEGRADQISLENLSEALDSQKTKIEGSADATFDVSGRALIAGKQADLDWESLKVELNLLGKNVRVNGRETGELKLVAHTSQGGRIDASLTTGILSRMGADQKSVAESIRASIELRKPGRPAVIESEMANLDIGPLLSLFLPDMASTLKGTIAAKFRLEGPTTDAQGNATFEAMRGGLTIEKTDLRVADNPVQIETPAVFAFENSQIRVSSTRLLGPGIDLNLNGALGLKDEAPMNFAIRGTINLDRLPPISQDIFMFGTVEIDALAAGSVADPQLKGKMEIAGFALSSSAQPIFINDGTGTVTLSGDKLTLDRFTANANEGTIEANGSTRLENFRPVEWKYVIKANNAQVVLQDLNGNLSGSLTLAGTPQGQTLTGNVTIPQAEFKPNVDIDTLSVGGQATLSFSSFDTSEFDFGKLGIPPVNLNIRIEARDSLIIRNEQVYTVGTGLLMITGRIDNPDTNGRITLDGGTLRFRGQLYEITNGALDLPPGGAAPLLNLVAEKTTGGTRVYVGLVGPIDSLDLTLRTEPQLPRDEIIQLITTGRTEANSLVSQDPLITGVGTAASLLSSGLISRPAEQLLGLSRFQIDPIIRPNANPAARLTVGQQVLRNFYLSYSTNLATEQDQTAIAEYTLSNRFSALATYTQGGSAARQSVREGVFTIELRGRQRFSLGFKPDNPFEVSDPNGALSRIMRPKLPTAQVEVSQMPDLKLTQRKLRELLPVMNQGFSRSLARLGESRLREYLQETGYFFAEVKSRCEPASCAGDNLKLYYDIEPNVVYDLKEIRIEGTDLLDLPDIESYLQSQTASRLGGKPLLKDLPVIGGYVRGLTSNDRLKNDEEFLRAYLADIGYRDARVKSRLAVKPDNDDLIVIFDVDAGTQTEIAETVVRGNTILPAAELLKSVSVQANEAFSATRARAGAQRIKQLYAQRGFLEAEVDLQVVNVADDRVKLLYNVSEGARAVIKEIEITGTTKTGKGWIRRYFDFKEGEVLTPAQIRQTQRDLYATNAFREVNLRTDPIGGDDGAAHRVTLNLTEAKPLLFVYGLGYSTDDGARGLLELANTNLGGTLTALSFRSRASQREQFYQLSYTDLRPFGSRFPTTLGVFYNRDSNLIPSVRRRQIDFQGNITPADNNTFGLNRFAAFIQTERKLADRTSVRLRYNLERADLFDLDPNFFSESEVTRNEKSIKLGMVSIGFTRDSRDNVLNPRFGQLISADHSVAMNLFGGSESFNKFFATYQRYKTLDQFTPLLKDSTLAFSARIGLGGTFRDSDRDGNGRIDSYEQNQLLPISERFFSGGATTLRGFRFETAGPQTILPPQPVLMRQSDGSQKVVGTLLPTLFPVGGNALGVFNLELRYPLTSRLRLVPFYDFGNVFRRVNDFSFRGMTSSVGLGLRFNTPLGPIGVDYGFLIDPPSFPFQTTDNRNGTLRQPRGAFHVRFGQSF